MPATVQTPTTLLTSAGTSTVTKNARNSGHQQLAMFGGNWEKTRHNGEKFMKKDTKRVKVAHF
jgi:hypothetical protein